MGFIVFVADQGGAGSLEVLQRGRVGEICDTLRDHMRDPDYNLQWCRFAVLQPFGQ